MSDPVLCDVAFCTLDAEHAIFPSARRDSWLCVSLCGPHRLQVGAAKKPREELHYAASRMVRASLSLHG